MQAVQTKFLGPTNNQGSRVKAYSEGFPRGVTVGWDYGAGNDSGLSDVEANHDRAARAFIRAKGWQGTWVRGATREGYVYVCISRDFAQWRSGAGRAVYRNGKEAYELRRVGTTVSPVQADEAVKVFAACAGGMMRDFLIVQEDN